MVYFLVMPHNLSMHAMGDMGKYHSDTWDTAGLWDTSVITNNI